MRVHKRLIRRFFMIGLVISASLAAPRPTRAHPMGNFSISHYAGIEIEWDLIELRYLIDMAEIPTFQEIQQTGIVPKPGDPGLSDYLVRKAEELKAGLRLEVDGRPLVLQVVSQDMMFPPGAGGLPTMKLGFVYRAKISQLSSGRARRLFYRDANFPDRAGWKEIVAAAGQGIRMTSSSVPSKDRSFHLANYPTDLLNSPPQDLEARVAYVQEGREESLRAFAKPKSPAPPRPGGHRQQAVTGSSPTNPDSRNPNPDPMIPNPESGRVGSLSLQANQQSTPRNAFTELVATKQLSLWFLLLAATIAAGLGGLHALEPGHGKTLVAAYLVGSRGSASHACLLGLIVTASHTAGVYLLGAVTLYASKYVVPERLYPWLGVISGLTIAGLGFYLFLRRYRGETHTPVHLYAHEHRHAHEHAHHQGHDEHHGHLHPQDLTHHSHGAGQHATNGHDSHGHQHFVSGEKVSYRELLALGITGGMVPCPAALVVLLSAVSLRRIGFGLFLIVAFSVGLAAVLIAIGLLMVYAGRLMSRLQTEGPLVTRWLPLTSAFVITVVGLSITVRALVTAAILRIRL